MDWEGAPIQVDISITFHGGWPLAYCERTGGILDLLPKLDQHWGGRLGGLRQTQFFYEKFQAHNSNPYIFGSNDHWEKLQIYYEIWGYHGYTSLFWGNKNSPRHLKRICKRQPFSKAPRNREVACCHVPFGKGMFSNITPNKMNMMCNQQFLMMFQGVHIANLDKCRAGYGSTTCFLGLPPSQACATVKHDQRSQWDGNSSRPFSGAFEFSLVRMSSREVPETIS